MWWGPGRYGYTRSVKRAGLYSRCEATAICAEALPQAVRLAMLTEIPVRLADLQLVGELADSAWAERVSELLPRE
jgi:hypothetical protein